MKKNFTNTNNKESYSSSPCFNTDLKRNYKKREKSHSSIFNYEGLKTALIRHHQKNAPIKIDSKIKPKNKSPIIIHRSVTPTIYPPQKIEKEVKPNVNNNKKNNTYVEVFNYNNRLLNVTKLKEMNSDMDIILTGMKENLDSRKKVKGKNVISFDYFIGQINSEKSKDDGVGGGWEEASPDVDTSFSDMSISRFSFKIIDKKKYFIDINALGPDEKLKTKFIFGENLENLENFDKFLDLDDIINRIYEYKNKCDSLLESKDEEYFKDIAMKHFEAKKLEKENECLKDEINFLKECLANSFYKGDLLLKRYYDTLNKIYSNVHESADDITNDVLNKK